MKAGCSLNVDPQFTRVPSTAILRTYGIHIGKSATTSRRPSRPSVERIDGSGGNGVTRQRALIGDSFNDEQWSDDLLDPWSC